MRHRVYFLNPIQGRDPDTGEEIKTWIQSIEYWAKVDFKEVGSDERMLQDKLTPMTAADITLRYFDGITTQMEVVHEGLKYKILSVLPDHKRCYVTLETVQVGALRDQGVAESDGEILQDSSGNALVIGDGDTSANYVAPGLTFLNDADEEFNP